MELHFKREEYNWGDRFFILDSNNNRKYRVKSSIVLWNRKFVIEDLDKNVLAVIKNEPKSLLKKKFYVIINEEQRAAVTKEISLLPKYTVEGLDWQMNGVMRHCYQLLSGGREVAAMETKSTGWGYRPVLTISQGTDELLGLAMALIFSYVMYAEEGGNSTDYR